MWHDEAMTRRHLGVMLSWAAARRSKACVKSVMARWRGEAAARCHSRAVLQMMLQRCGVRTGLQAIDGWRHAAKHGPRRRGKKALLVGRNRVRVMLSIFGVLHARMCTRRQISHVMARCLARLRWTDLARAFWGWLVERDVSLAERRKVRCANMMMTRSRKERMRAVWMGWMERIDCLVMQKEEEEREKRQDEARRVEDEKFARRRQEEDELGQMMRRFEELQSGAELAAQEQVKREERRWNAAVNGHLARRSSVMLRESLRAWGHHTCCR